MPPLKKYLTCPLRFYLLADTRYYVVCQEVMYNVQFVEVHSSRLNFVIGAAPIGRLRATPLGAVPCTLPPLTHVDWSIQYASNCFAGDPAQPGVNCRLQAVSEESTVSRDEISLTNEPLIFFPGCENIFCIFG